MWLNFGFEINWSNVTYLTVFRHRSLFHHSTIDLLVRDVERQRVESKLNGNGSPFPNAPFFKKCALFNDRMPSTTISPLSIQLVCMYVSVKLNRFNLIVSDFLLRILWLEINLWHPFLYVCLQLATYTFTVDKIMIKT